MFSDASQTLLSVVFDSVPVSWSLNSCWICGPMKIPSFFLASLILGNYFLKEANPSLSLSITYQSPWTWDATNTWHPNLILSSNLIAKIQFKRFSHEFWQWLPLQFEYHSAGNVAKTMQLILAGMWLVNHNKNTSHTHK